MNDCEAEVFSRIADVLRKKFPKINMTSEYVHEPASFPHVSILMSENVPVTRLMTNGEQEVYSTATFEINVYSNLVSGKKSQCKEVMSVIDDLMYRMNFRRQSMMQLPNAENSSIYRINARYRAVTDGKYFYRR